MKLHCKIPFRAALGTFVWASVAGHAHAYFQEYCSSENTGSDTSGVFDIYNSNLACATQCDGFAFAVVQWQECWCSNYIPLDQQNVGNCNQHCPGYPGDGCGNESDGLFGYVPLNSPPSGTAGAVSSTSSTLSASTSSDDVPVSSFGTPSPTSSASPEAPPRTSSPSAGPLITSLTTLVVPVVTSTLFVSTILSFPTSAVTTSLTPFLQSSTSAQSATTPTSESTTSIAPTTATPSSTSSLTSTTFVAPVGLTTSSSPSETPSPVTSVERVTISGSIVTETVTSTPLVVPDSPDSPGGLDPLSFQRKSLSGGAIAGTVIGVLVGVAALLVGAFFLWRRRRRGGTGGGATRPRRATSVLSRTGLMSRNRPVSMAERDDEEPYYAGPAAGTHSGRHSMLFGAGVAAEGVHPASPLGSSHDTASPRRHSRPLVYDQRLNPSALFANHEANGSRVSMQDQQDYSRPLGIANPDFRPSFDSR